MSHPDHHAKSRVAAISMFASAGMAAAKFAVGIAIGSLALISEALHSSVDVVATVITWLVVRVSDRPADDEHHYGHGKLESLSALGVIAMLYVLAGGILVESYSRLREGAPPPTLSAIPFVVLLIDIAVNFWRARALHRAAHDTKSQALAADALHFASDVMGSTAHRRAHQRRRQKRSGPCPAWSMSNGCGCGWSVPHTSSTRSCRCRAPIRSIVSTTSSARRRTRSQAP